MNIRNSLKTLAVALPLAMTPAKSSAQVIAKGASRVATVTDARVGAGMGYSSFFGSPVYEMKAVGSVGARGSKFAAGLEAAVGKNTQEVRANIGIPVVSTPNGHVDVGAVGRYQHNRLSAVDGVIKDSEVNSLDPKFANKVSLNNNKAFVGAYVAPSVRIGNVHVTPHVEGGVAGFANHSHHVSRANVPHIIDNEGMVHRDNLKFAANAGVNVDADLGSGVRAGVDINRSSFDHSTSFLAKITYNIDRLFKRHHK